MTPRPPRLAVRAVIIQSGKLLLVNAYPGDQSDLWCAPGGGVEPGQSLPENLIREVWEETGLNISVGDPVGVNEFHNPDTGYHQVEVFFKAQVLAGQLNDDWQDSESIVTRRRFFSPQEVSTIRLKPDSLPDMAFGENPQAIYDPLERIVR